MSKDVCPKWYGFLHSRPRFATSTPITLLSSALVGECNKSWTGKTMTNVLSSATHFCLRVCYPHAGHLIWYPLIASHSPQPLSSACLTEDPMEFWFYLSGSLTGTAVMCISLMTQIQLVYFHYIRLMTTVKIESLIFAISVIWLSIRSTVAMLIMAKYQ